MYLLYVDESGHPTSWTEYRSFILGGVAVHEGHVMRLARAMDDVQRRYFPDVSYVIELHAQHMAKGKGRWRKVPRNLREQMIEDVYEIVAQAHYPGLILFSVVVDISFVGYQPSAYENAFEHIVDMFDLFLIKNYKEQNNPQKGLMIFDETRLQGNIQELLIRARSSKDVFEKEIYNILDVPLFTSSKITRLLQLADFCSYAIFQHYQNNNSRHFDIIQDRFYRDRQGDLQGLRHLIGGRDSRCDCGATHVLGQEENA